MKKFVFPIFFTLLFLFGVPKMVQADTEMYRLYNPNSGEHFYTKYANERDTLRRAGWQFENVGWVAPDSGDEVYRLYNPNNGDHHYTLAPLERDVLVKAGWRYEGVGWYSDKNKTIPLYRVYNKNNLGAGSHHYTTSAAEKNNLLKHGWKDENIGWYALKPGYELSLPPIVVPTPTPQPNPTPQVSTGQGLIKGSQNGIYHVPGSKYYNRTKNVVQWFNTVEEAIAAGYRAPRG